MGLNERKNHFMLLLNIYTEACCIKRFFFHGKKAHRPNSWYVHKSWRKQNGEQSGCWFLGPQHKGITYRMFIVLSVLRHFSTSFPLIRQRMYRGRILGRNPDKRLKSFPPCYSQSHHTALPWDFYFFKLRQPLIVSRVQLLYTVKEKEENQIENHTLFPMG